MGWCEVYCRPILAHLIPPVLGGYRSHGIEYGPIPTTGAVLNPYAAPFWFPFHTPQQGGFSTSNEEDDGVAYNPHATPHLPFPITPTVSMGVSV